MTKVGPEGTVFCFLALRLNHQTKDLNVKKYIHFQYISFKNFSQQISNPIDAHVCLLSSMEICIVDY